MCTKYIPMASKTATTLASGESSSRHFLVAVWLVSRPCAPERFLPLISPTFRFLQFDHFPKFDFDESN